MALKYDEFIKLEAQNKFYWDTNAIKKTAESINSFSKGVNDQRSYTGTRWSDEEFRNQHTSIRDLKSELGYLRAYANSIKDSDAETYNNLQSYYDQASGQLDDASKWFSQYSDPNKRARAYEQVTNMRSEREKSANIGAALHDIQLGKSTAAEQAEKYGLDEKELEKANNQLRQIEKQSDMINKYGKADYNSLVSALKEGSKSRIADEIKTTLAEMKVDENQTQEQREATVFDSYAKKYGMTVDEIKEIYDGSKEVQGFTKYASNAISDEERQYISQRLLESSSLKELEEIKKNLPSGSYYDDLRSGIREAIENKKEEKYYFDLQKQYPHAESIIDTMESQSKKSSGGSMGANLLYDEDYHNASKAYDELKAEMGDDWENYVKYRQRYKTRKKSEELQQGISEWASQNPFNATVATIASTPINMIGAPLDVVNLLASKIDEATGGDGYYDPKSTSSYTAQNIRSTVNQMIANGTDNEALRHFAQLAYSTATSMSDMSVAIAANAIPVVGQYISGAMFFSSAGMAAANEVIENGGSLDQATATLIAQGAAELIFENISLDKLKAFRTTGNVKGLKDIATNALKQTVTEGSEEVATTLANTFTDSLINGRNSDINRSVQNYIKQGLSKEEAEKRAWDDWKSGIIDDFVGGAISGGIFGAATSGISLHSYKKSKSNTTVDLGGVKLSAKDAQEKSREYYHDMAQKITDSGKTDVINGLIEDAKSGGKKSKALASSIEQTIKEKGSDAVRAADVENLLTTLYGENVDAHITGENIGSAVAIQNLENKVTGEVKSSQVKTYNSKFNDAGTKVGSEAAGGSSSAFGTTFKNGVYATDNDGNKVIIKSIDSSVKEYGSNDRTVVLKTADGNTVNADEVTIDNADFERLVNLAGTYDTLGARALLANYEEAQANGVSTDDYIEHFEALYKIGRSGVTFENANKSAEFKSIINSVGANVAQNAMNAGNYDAEGQIELENALYRRVRVGNAKTSAGSRVFTADSGVEIKGSEAFVALMNNVANAMDSDIVLTDRLPKDTRGVYSKGRIYINSELDEHVIAAVALHEAVHAARVYAPAEFRALEKFVMNYLVSTGQDVQTQLDNIASIWGQDAKSREAQIEELVANTVMSLASDEKAFTKAIGIEENKNLFNKVKEAIKNIVARIKEWFKTVDENGVVSGHNMQAQPWLGDVQALEQLAQKFNELTTAAKQNKAEFGERESEERYDIDGTKGQSEYERDITIDDVKKVQSIAKPEKSFSVNDFTKKDIELTKRWAVKFYKEFGQKSPFFRAWFGDWRANERNEVDTIQLNRGKKFRGKVYNNDVNINIDVSVIGEKHILNHFHNNDFSHCVMENIKEITEKAVLLDTHVSTPSGNTKHKNTSFMHSFYIPVNYNNDIFVVKLFVEEYYNEWNEKVQRRNYDLSKIEILANANRFGGKKPTPLYASASISIKNISDLHAFVKKYDNNFNPPESSKVVDADGMPLVVYHQTDADFTVFNTESKGAGKYDDETPNGIFLKPTDNDIGLKGKKQMALYANIRNPLSVRNRDDLVSFYKNHISGYEEAKRKITDIDSEYKAKFKEEEKRENKEYQKLWEAWRRGEISKEEYGEQTKRDKLEEIMLEWEEKTNEARKKVKDKVSDYFTNSKYDGVIIENDSGSFGRSTKTYIAFEKNQVKSATDNIGTFDNDNDDIRYSKDDAFTVTDDGDLFFGEESGALDEVNPDDELGRTYGEIIEDEVNAGNSSRIDVRKLIDEYSPEEAVFMLYEAAMSTNERGIRGYSSIKLEDEDYIRAARRVMKRYGILKKNNKGFDEELAQRIREFVEGAVKNPKSDFRTHLSGLATDCQRYLERSGDYSRGDLEDTAKTVFSILRGKTLILTPFAESQILENFGGLRGLRRAFRGYVNVGKEEDIGRYKNPVYIDDVIDNISDATTNGSSMGQMSILFPDGERPDSLSGWNWLHDLLRNTLSKKFESPYANGMIENVPAAATEMAFDIATEIVDAKAGRAVTMRNVDKKTIRELAEDRKKALSERDALHKTKAERYQKEINKLKAKLQQERGKRELAEEDYSILRRMVKDDNRVYREQYQQQVRAQTDIEAVRRTVNRLRTMIVNPSNEKFVPPEILHNKAFLNTIEALADAIVLNERSAVGDKMADLLTYISETKSKLQEESDFYTAFDKELVEGLTNIARGIKFDFLEDSEGNRRKVSRKSFNSYEIHELRELVDEIVYRIESARKLLLRRDGMIAQEASEKVIEQTNAIDDNKARRVFNGFARNMMNPLRAVNQMSNYNEDSELRRLFYELNEGQRKSWFWQMTAEKMFAELVNGNEDAYRKSCNDVIHIDYTVNGKGYHADMTKMQGLQILMTWKREQQSKMLHMRRGGIVIADPKTVAKGKGNAWAKSQELPVGSDLINQIVKNMGDFENKYMRTAEKYFNEVAKSAINETFMVTRHREIARSDYYIPVRVDSKFTKAEIQSLKFDFTIEGAGSYKHITPHAPQPILIESLNSIIDRHISQTGKLYGLDIPLINFKRMFKGVTRSSIDNFVRAEWDSVKKALANKFGDKNVKYIEDTISALEGGRNKEDTPFSSIAEHLYSARVRTSLVGNLGVVIKQAASYPTAGLYLSAKDLTVGLGKFFAGKKSDGKRFLHFYQKTVDEIDKYTAQHYIRRKGMSVQEVSDMLSRSKLAQKAPTPLNPVKWIQAMDCATTAALWEATKSHIESEYKKSGKQVGTETYFKEVAKLYDTIIEDTQPMYDELHRSDFQKKGGSFVKFLFPFKTQPLQNMGILADSATEFVTKRDKASAKKFAKAVSSQISSNLVFSLMTFAAAVLRHKTDRYKDEEDNIDLLPHLMWDMFSNAINAVLPVGGDYIIPSINDIVSSFEKGKFSYSNLADATELSIVNDWFKKVGKSANILLAQLDGTNKADINPYDLIWKILDVPGNFAEIFGIPYSNLSLLFKGVGNYFKDTQNYGLTNNYGELKTDNITNHILKAYNSGDKKKAEDLRRLWVQQFMSEGKTEEKATDAVADKLIAGLTADKNVAEAAQAHLDGDLVKHREIKDSYAAKGIDENLFDSAVTKVENELTEDEGESSGNKKAKSEYSYKEAFTSLSSGNAESYELAKQSIAEKLVADGEAEDLEEAREKVDKKMKGFQYTKSLFEDYHSVRGEKFSTAREKLLRIYGSEDELKKKYEEFVKKYIN